MAEFIRARSDEQKAQRIAEVKAAAVRQFETRPYHEITLTTIADELGWSRANLYKYVATKEEIFLLVDADEYGAYFEALLAALPEGCGLTADVVAEVWAGIANAHQRYFRLGEILSAIIETNVTLERLVEFKRGYLAYVDAMAERLPLLLPIDRTQVQPLIESVYFHAVGAAGICRSNPLVVQALRELGAEAEHDFRAEMRDFIGMCLKHYAG